MATFSLSLSRSVSVSISLHLSRHTQVNRTIFTRMMNSAPQIQINLRFVMIRCVRVWLIGRILLRIRLLATNGTLSVYLYPSLANILIISSTHSHTGPKTIRSSPFMRQNVRACVFLLYDVHICQLCVLASLPNTLLRRICVQFLPICSLCFVSGGRVNTSTISKRQEAWTEHLMYLACEQKKREGEWERERGDALLCFVRVDDWRACFAFAISELLFCSVLLYYIIISMNN